MRTNKEKMEGMIETVTNSNGTAIKFADGTMICIKATSYSNIAVLTKVGEIYTTEELDVRQLGRKFYFKTNCVCFEK